MRRQAAYLRVSTPQQSEALQREAIQRAAAARGEPVELWFQEKRSGSALDRPELDSVRALARRGELAQLWVFRLDRLTRRGAHDLLTLVTELRQHGCKVVSVSEGIDFAGPWAEAVLAVLGAAAAIELEALRDRTAAAKRKAEAAGKRWGRPPAAGDAARRVLLDAVDNGLTLRKAAKQAGLTFGTAQRMVAKSRQAGKKAND